MSATGKLIYVSMYVLQIDLRASYLFSRLGEAIFPSKMRLPCRSRKSHDIVSRLGSHTAGVIFARGADPRRDKSRRRCGGVDDNAKAAERAARLLHTSIDLTIIAVILAGVFTCGYVVWNLV